MTAAAEGNCGVTLLDFNIACPPAVASCWPPLGSALSIGAVYLANRYLGPIRAEADHSVADSRGIAEGNPYGRLSRVQPLLSSMR